ncbi:MAG: hypothetical protein ABII23_01625 [bacterium]
MFIRLKLQMWVNEFKRLSFGKTLKILFFLTLGSVLLLSFYFGFFRLISYLETVPIIGELLIIKFISMVFLLSFGMIIISSIISGFSTLYYSSDLTLWMYAPLPVMKVYMHKSAETLVYSSWMIVLAVIPFLAAYASVKELGIIFYIVLVSLIIPFIITAGCIGIMICTLLVSICPYRKLRDGVIIMVVLIGSGVYILFRLMQPEELIRPDVFEQMLIYISLLKTPASWYVPSWWIASAIESFTAHNWEHLFIFSSLLILCSLISIICMSMLARIFFYHGWSSVHEGYRRKTNELDCRLFAGKTSPGYSIIWKDIKIFMRDVNQWPQLLLLSALIVVYVFSIYKLPLDTLYLKSLISFLNIGMIGFVMSAVSLRLVFPSMSLEGDYFWILSSAPISRTKIMWMKFIYSFPVILCLGVILSFISNKYLDADAFVQIMSLGSIVLIALTLSGMGIGMGSAFPKFKIENIARIESSAGGILYMIFSFLYLSLVISMTAVPMRMYFFARLARSSGSFYHVLFIAWAVLLGLSGVFFGSSFMYGRKKLMEYEV